MPNRTRVLAPGTRRTTAGSRYAHGTLGTVWYGVMCYGYVAYYGVLWVLRGTVGYYGILWYYDTVWYYGVLRGTEGTEGYYGC